MNALILTALALSSVSNAFTHMENGAGATLQWEEASIPFAINPDNPYGLEDWEVEEAVLGAIEAWEDVGAAIEFDYQGFSDVSETAYDGVNLIYFDKDWDMQDNQLAITSNWSTDTGQLVAFDIAMNADGWEWSVDEDEAAMDLQNSLTHEIGHVLGIGHADQDDLATMWKSTEEGELLKRDLRPDDEEALLSIYGEDDAMALACNAAPADGLQGAMAWLVGLAAAALALGRRRSG